MPIADQLAHALTDHSIDLTRLSASVMRKIQQLLLALQKELKDQINAYDISELSRARLVSLLNHSNQIINSNYKDINDFATSQYAALAVTETSVVASLINRFANMVLIRPSTLLPANTLRILASETLILGSPSAAWWSTQSATMAFKFAAQVRTGAAAGKTTAEIARGVAELTARSVSAATALVRTSIATVANAARMSVYKGNSTVVGGVQQVSTLDTHTSDTCIAYDMNSWDLDGEPLPGTTLPFVSDGGSDEGVPRHWLCRSIIIPLTKSWKDLGIPIEEISDGTRASMDGQVSSKLTFGEWLDSKTKEQQDEILGPGKAQLWRDGKISQSSLLDQSGRPLTLAELKDKHGVAP